MAKPLSVSALRANLYRLLDEVVRTGIPLEVERNGPLLRIAAVQKVSRLTNLKPHPGAIVAWLYERGAAVLGRDVQRLLERADGRDLVIV